MLETSNIVVKPFKRLKTFKVSVKRICYCSSLTLALNILQGVIFGFQLKHLYIHLGLWVDGLYASWVQGGRFIYILGPGWTVYIHLGSWVGGLYTSWLLGGRFIYILGPGWTVYIHLGSRVDGLYTSWVLGGRFIYILASGWTVYVYLGSRMDGLYTSSVHSKNFAFFDCRKPKTGS